MNGDQLKTVRAKLKLTQQQLGDALGIPANTIARWERGEFAIQQPKLLELAVAHLRCRARVMGRRTPNP